MPFYLRKSVSAGPFRFNFSKGGAGVSVGVKGLRFGTGPRGHYVHAGRGGVYYRSSVGRAGTRNNTSDMTPSVDATQLIFETNNVDMVEIESGDVQAMRDEVFSDVLDEINAKRQQISAAILLGLGLGILGLLPGIGLGPEGMLFSLLAIPGTAVGRWLDSYRRTAVIFYDLEPEVDTAYRAVADAFDRLSNCAGKWHVEAGGAVQDLTAWKRNAGASHIVQKNKTALFYKLPNVIKSNVTPPAMHVGKQVIYFLPDVALVEDGGRFGAVGYSDLEIRRQDSNFIEEGTVPKDAQVVAHTWKHPNKSGGPDRRFRNNYQIPVCRYEVVHLTSTNGINEMLEFSKTGVAAPFSAALGSLPHSQPERRRSAPRLAS